MPHPYISTNCGNVSALRCVFIILYQYFSTSSTILQSFVNSWWILCISMKIYCIKVFIVYFDELPDDIVIIKFVRRKLAYKKRLFMMYLCIYISGVEVLFLSEALIS